MYHEEDKSKICELLLAALQATRSHSDMTELCYDPSTETVRIRWASGGTRTVNVAADSGTAMIKDIMRSIE